MDPTENDAEEDMLVNMEEEGAAADDDDQAGPVASDEDEAGDDQVQLRKTLVCVRIVCWLTCRD